MEFSPNVMDNQLRPVKLIFIKFSDQLVDEVEVVWRMQAGLIWTAFNATVTGWSMDKAIERIRVLGISPETDEAEIRLFLGIMEKLLMFRSHHALSD